MMPYYLLFAATLLLSFFALARPFPGRVAAVLLFIVIGFFVTLAFGTNDYAQYQYIYEGVTDLASLRWLGYSVGIATPIEPGFALLILLEKNLSGSFVVFWFAFTALSLTLKFYAFSKLSPFVLLTILVYIGDEYFWKDISGIRGAMASGIVLLSMIFAVNRQPLRFAVAMLAALSFHFAAIVAFPLYWYRIFGERWFLATIFVFSVIVASLGGLGLFLPEVAARLGFAETSRIIKYAGSQYVTGIRPFGGTFTIHVLVTTLLLMTYGRLIRAWRWSHVLITAYVYGTALMFIFIDYGIIAGRIREMLCIPAGAVLLPTLLLLVRGQQRLLPYGAVAAYAGLWFYLMMRDRAPYENVLFLT